MRKLVSKFWKKVFVFVLVVPILLGQAGMVTAKAEEDDVVDPNAAIPEIVLVNGPVFEVEAGRTSEIHVKLKNGSSYPANAIVVQPTFPDVNDTPFTVAFEGNENRINSIAGRSERTITLHVNMDATASTKNYPVTLNYTYFNDFNRKFTGSNTIYVKVKNIASSPQFELQDLKMTPDSIKAGERAQISGYLFNTSYIAMHDVEIILDQLTPDGISVSNDSNSKKFTRIMPSSGAAFSFPIMAGVNMKTGNYPVTIKTTYKDENGKEYEQTQNFYIDLGGGSGTNKPALEIQNMKEPDGVYGVNQDFNVEFDLVNTGAGDATNVKITATGMGEGGVVPKSGSIKSLATLKPGESRHLVFTFAATSASLTQNHAIEFAVEYEDGSDTPVTFKQYAGANVSNPEADKKDEDDKKSNKPKIIVSDYQSDPVIVMAGEEFDLNMEFLNTHKDKAVRNIKMFLTLSEETSSDSEKTGNIFTPVDSSNTFYFDSIGAKGKVNKKLRLFVVPDAQPKTYTLTVNFEYEDLEGNEFTATELLGINVKQKTELDLDEFTLPNQIEMGMPINVSFSYYNTGKVTLRNLMIRIEGDVESASKSTYIGNLESGASDYYEGEFSALNMGQLPVSIIISYDDPSGETIEIKRDFDLTVIEPMMIDEGMGMEDFNQKPPIWQNVKLMAGIGAAVLAFIALMIILGIRKHRKKLAEEAFLAADDDVEGTETEEYEANDESDDDQPL